MVFDTYSNFVNNHHLAMETVKTLARQKQGFADFLKVLKLTVLMSKLQCALSCYYFDTIEVDFCQGGVSCIAAKNHSF